MNKDKLFSISAVLLIAVTALSLGYIFFTRVFVWLLPFLIAWAIAFAVRPLANKISEKTHIPVKLWRVALALLALLSVVALGGVLIWQTALAVIRFLGDLGRAESVGGVLEALGAPILRLFRGQIFPEAVRDEVSGAFSAAISSLATRLADALSGFVGKIPRILISAVVTALAVAYFALDLENINAFVKGLTPHRVYLVLVRIKDGFLSVGVKYIRSYLTLSFITFSMTLLGLILLRVEHAAVIALLAAAFDVLPVVGVGTLLVPWAVLEIIGGNTFVGISLIILFVAVALVRQIIEPRVIGKSLNIHPILTLFLIFVGYALFGFVGLLLLPIVAVGIAVFQTEKGKDHPS
ncbi:MAG: AI-2E family transporter [Clostridia bacterium]|nr:AI-2E family transporter [Clostridia bacterium]